MYKEIILTNKPNLIEWLKSDSLILQYAQSKRIVTPSQYEELMSKQVPRDMVIKLLDIILAKGENECREFLILLKNDAVNESSPELRAWIRTIDTSVQKSDRHQGKSEAANCSTQETANTAGQSGVQVTISASGSSNVFSPTIVGSRTGPIEMNMTPGPSGKSNGLANCKKTERFEKKKIVTDYQKFLKTNLSLLVQNVKNIDPIVDDLDWHRESIANVRAKPTNQKKMRELLDCVNCESMAKQLFNTLLKQEESLMKELLN